MVSSYYWLSVLGTIYQANIDLSLMLRIASGYYLYKAWGSCANPLNGKAREVHPGPLPRGVSWQTFICLSEGKEDGLYSKGETKRVDRLLGCMKTRSHENPSFKQRGANRTSRQVHENTAWLAFYVLAEIPINAPQSLEMKSFNNISKYRFAAFSPQY
jgi:hypothetical protein